MIELDATSRHPSAPPPTGGNAGDVDHGVEVARLTGSLGAEVHGLDLASGDGAAVAALRRLVVEHQVVAVRDQRIDLERLSALTVELGGFGETPFLRSVPGHPGVVEVVKEADEASLVTFGGAWHSDWSFQESPPSFTLLHAAEVPPQGGDTLFADQHRAYETLSAGLRHTLDGLRAVHSAGRAYAPTGILAATSRGRTMPIDTSDEARAEQVHPLVITHPETGRRALFCNPTYTVRLDGWTAAEGAPLLGHLYDHGTRPEMTCRVRWAPETLVIWDNRCTQHLAVNDYDGHRRQLHRTTVVGAPPT